MPRKPIPFEIIYAANNGDTTAIQYILKHYEGYIARLSTKILFDSCGSQYHFVDKDLQDSLTAALLQLILDFEI